MKGVRKKKTWFKNSVSKNRVYAIKPENALATRIEERGDVDATKTKRKIRKRER